MGWALAARRTCRACLPSAVAHNLGPSLLDRPPMQLALDWKEAKDELEGEELQEEAERIAGEWAAAQAGGPEWEEVDGSDSDGSDSDEE